VLPPEVDAGTPRPGGVLRARLPLEPAGLSLIHDGLVDGWTRRVLQGTVYESLAELDRDTHPRYALKPLLAESWEERDGALTVKLRAGVRFHDGSDFTSRDAKAVLEAVLKPQHLTFAARSFFSEVSAVEAPDSLTFIVRFRQPYFLGARSVLTALPMMPAAGLQAETPEAFNALPIHRAPVGTGPFRFDGWEAGKEIRLRRFDGYRGPPPWRSSCGSGVSWS
jgi:peptide/nickel transport system substrate-binding protein